MKLEGKRVLMRVDWNIPLGRFRQEDMLKVERSIQDIHELAQRGAIVILLTHLGRPEKRDLSLSTARLLPAVKKYYKLRVTHHSASVSNAVSRKALCNTLDEAKPGSIHLLENVRFEKGEDECANALVKAYAELGDLFVNDAFASSHRKHASVFGLAKALPAYAGPDLVREVDALNALIKSPKKPFMAVIGGFKLSTKIPIIKSLCLVCDQVLVGGAMANTFEAAQGKSVGKSFVEKASLAEAKRLLTKYKKKIQLPIDVKVVPNPDKRSEPRIKSVAEIGKNDVVIDVGVRTLKDWNERLTTAKTILWNGPIGKCEIPEYAFGSRFIAKAIGTVAKGAAFGVAGGGDTLPVVLETKTQTWFDHVSVGGGAMLEFLVKKGKLPGLTPLEKKISDG